jgi:hypothetical protein
VGLAMENVGIFYGHLVYFMTIWYILRSFGLFYDYLVYFMTIWYILCLLGTFFRFRYNEGVKKNLATLVAKAVEGQPIL